MIEFFIALVGILYFGIKIAGDRSADKRYKRKIASWESERDRWRASVVDESLEAEVEAYVNDPKTFFEAKEKANEICPVLPEFCQTPENWIRIIMASKGKLTYWDTHFGIKPQGYFGVGMYRLKESQLAFNNYMRWLGDTIRENGISERMVYDSLDGAGRYCSLDTAESAKSWGMGKYKWEPMCVNKYDI